MTESVFGFLGPLTAALAQRGVSQCVLLLDDPAYAGQLAQFDPQVRIVRVPMGGGRVVRRVALLNALLNEARSQRKTAIHAHGLLAAVLAVYAQKLYRLKARLYFSPHGSRAVRLLSAMGLGGATALRGLTAPRHTHVIATASTDVAPFSGFSESQVALIESPVAPAYFDTPRQEAPRPLIVSSGQTLQSRPAAVYAQLAVLLGAGASDLRFRWIGSVDGESEARLKAADVDVLASSTDAERARELASGWVYVATGAAHGFPIALAQAMALGLPCIAWNTPFHRDVIEHGRTGYLCESAEECLRYLEMLNDSPESRALIGRAARVAATERFGTERFQASVEAVYGADATLLSPLPRNA